ncbi:pseudoazurin [Ochrobactrum vermis]|uniref:Pseudoazurin n=1 Tax=Ochrobactrum vermis TaxID=1827297 RepID=A0ABU8PMC9_9HYPH|nr:pseudoazurin [Ochrobactrum vermis]PQZ26948.1 pseudoazurin [Ochrobactrum vermis]
MTSSLIALILSTMLLLLAGGDHSNAAEIEVRMLNRGVKGPMVFEPDFVRASPGDTINFIAIDRGHDVVSIPGMLPENVKPFKSKLGESFSITLQDEGVYGVKCSPHYGMGMVALIAVGKPVNEAEAVSKSHPGKSKQRFSELFKMLNQP